MPEQNVELRSLITERGTLELTLDAKEMPVPKDDEVVVRIQAAAVNPSDLLLLLGPADAATAKQESATRTVLQICQGALPAVQSRVGHALATGNEGAGLVVAAGDAPEAQRLLGRTVGVAGVSTYARFRAAKAGEVLETAVGTTAKDAAGWYVNPMTALGFFDTMLTTSYIGLVHTAAASALGQILLRICLHDEVPLVNIVRKPEQAQLLRSLGATWVCDSSQQSFQQDLLKAVTQTGARLCFDALGGGTMASNVLRAMEIADKSKQSSYNRYGSSSRKQVYVYGSLERGPMVLNRDFGTSWDVGGWLVINYLNGITAERKAQLLRRIASELKTTFKTSFSGEFSLEEALQPKSLQRFVGSKTGDKFLITP